MKLRAAKAGINRESLLRGFDLHDRAVEKSCLLPEFLSSYKQRQVPQNTVLKALFVISVCMGRETKQTVKDKTKGTAAAPLSQAA